MNPIQRAQTRACLEQSTDSPGRLTQRLHGLLNLFKSRAACKAQAKQALRGPEQARTERLEARNGKTHVPLLKSKGLLIV